MNQSPPPSPEWRKSSFSGPEGDECVEVALVGDRIAVRDSKRPNDGILMVGPDEWAALLAGIREAEFD